MSCERYAQNSCSGMPVAHGHHRQCEGQTQVYNKCYDIKGGNYHITDTNYYNNYYNRYNHYYVTQRNITTDYVTDYNIYHYNQENIYNGCHSLGSYDIVANSQGCGQNWGPGYGQGYGQNWGSEWSPGCGQNWGPGWGQGCEHKCMPEPCCPCHK